jgi:hypothetical protein
MSLTVSIGVYIRTSAWFASVGNQYHYEDTSGCPHSERAGTPQLSIDTTECNKQKYIHILGTLDQRLTNG